MRQVAERVLEINEVGRGNYPVLVTVKHLEAELLFLFLFGCHHLSIYFVHILAEVDSLQVAVAGQVEVKSGWQPFEIVGAPKDWHLSLDAIPCQIDLIEKDLVFLFIYLAFIFD